MLRELHIENIAVIERADIAFGEGLNVMTGETGAGKSIVIDSIGAVLGERVSRELVRHGAEKGMVTAVFDADGCNEWLDSNDIEADGEIIIQRRINSDSKSSCRVCGVPVTAAQLKELALLLVDIHGQNDGRQLMDERKHLEYLDSFGMPQSMLLDYRNKYIAYLSYKKELSTLEMDEIEKERIRDSLSYQIAELERAQLKAGEYDGICARRDLLRNAEKLTEALELALTSLNQGEENAVSMLQNSGYYLRRAASFAPELEASAESLNDLSFALSDIGETVSDFLFSLDYSPEEYDELETRIALISKLMRKYSRDEDELIAYLEECKQKLDNLEYAEERSAKLRKSLAEAQANCCEKAAELSELRHKAAKKLEQRISTELKELNMPSVKFSVSFSIIDKAPGFDSHGCDDVRFLMSANAGEALGRISRIASGGELSRIMLAMKNVFAENDPVGTMIFDEIDTGVSGVAAQRVGEKLFSVSLGKQVMCVTHLPQIAAMADNHYLIKKEERNGRTYTDVLALDIDGRKKELARLHGGDNITDITLRSAEEQLLACEKFKSSRQP